jgi:thiol-disulfide isomerase/thioredoxin
MTSSLLSEPVFVFYKADGCKHCENLFKIWDAVKSSLKEVYPNLRFQIVTGAMNANKFDPNVTPSGLRIYTWFPQLLLVPGNIWDKAMASLGPKNNVDLKEGVQAINLEWVNGKSNYKPSYDSRDPKAIARWLKVALENEDFKRMQSGLGSVRPIVVPTTQSSTSVMSEQLLPNFGRTNYIASSTEKVAPQESMSNVCSMKIIPRR